VKTIVLSDLHLGAGPDWDLLRRADVRDLLFERLTDADRIVLLGDVLELRDRPLREVLDLASPFFQELGEVMAGREIVLMPGNHDHHLLQPWIERRRLDGAPEPLGLEERFEPAEGAARVLAERVRDAKVELVYPGIRLREDVFATHGHYLDRHLTVPTFERLGVAAVERALGGDPSREDPLDPAPGEGAAVPDEYERAQQPVYALLFALAQAGGWRNESGNPSARIWAAASGGETRVAKLRGWLLGSVALPGAIGVANRLGLGPVRSDLSAAAISTASLAAIGETVRRLGIDADHLIFGHTHRRGPMPGEDWTIGDGMRVYNTGNWVHAPGLLGETAAESPYWPGTIAVVEEEGAPRLEHLLDGLTREELAGS
jgi:predicted phosphodiesterase